MLQTGLDRLLTCVPRPLRHARVGLLTHAAGVGRSGAAARDLLAACADLRLVRLFAPEHGLRGERPAGEPVADGVDPATGLPVVSLYGPGSSAESDPFAGLDAVLADLQDIGTRYFTYVGTLRRLIGRAARAGVPVWVLDRPNPLGGARAGPARVPAGLRSLVAAFDVPIRHGLTIGELALLGAAEDGLAPGAVRVLPFAGLPPDAAFPAWGRPWVPPSPNASGPEMAELYPGTCLFEGTDLSEGRGTPYPFRQVGAPWLDGPALSARLEPLLPPGIVARPAWFLPTASKHAGALCQGVFLDLPPDGPRAADAALVAAARLLSLLMAEGRCALLVQGGVAWLDRLTGGPELRTALGRPAELAELLEAWRGEAAAFDGRRRAGLHA